MSDEEIGDEDLVEVESGEDEYGRPRVIRVPREQARQWDDRYWRSRP